MEYPKGHGCLGHHRPHLHHHHLIMPPPIDPLEIDVKNHHELIMRLWKYVKALEERIAVLEGEADENDNQQ